jgi:hypothetical protein
VRWTRKTIIAEIRRLHEAGEELYYSKAEDDHLNLVRAAGWHYGTWRRAVEAAGIEYESLSKYQRWSKKKIVERIRELHAEGQSLHWRAVSTHVDPPLAAAALRPNGFYSWREAIAAAGLNIDDVARYQEWDNEKVIKAIRHRKRAGLSMFSKSLQTEDQPLFCAARRRFGSWDGALSAAGLDAEKIRLRKYNPALNAPRKKSQNSGQGAPSTPVGQNGKGSGPIRLASKTAAKTTTKPASTSSAAKNSAAKNSATKNAASQNSPKPLAKNTAVKSTIKATAKVAAKTRSKVTAKPASRRTR